MKRSFLLFFSILPFSSGAICGVELKCADAVHWKRHKESGPFCYRYFTGDERNTFLGALAVCRYVHNATLIDKPPTVEEVHLLGIDRPIWIASPEDALLSLEWNVSVGMCYKMSAPGIVTDVYGSQCASQSEKAKSMCSVERVLIEKLETEFNNNAEYKFTKNPEEEKELYTFREAAGYCM